MKKTEGEISEVGGELPNTQHFPFIENSLQPASTPHANCWAEIQLQFPLSLHRE